LAVHVDIVIVVGGGSGSSSRGIGDSAAKEVDRYDTGERWNPKRQNWREIRHLWHRPLLIGSEQSDLLFFDRLR
jgi:hypothetical protein